MLIHLMVIPIAEVVLGTLAVAQGPVAVPDSGARVRVTYSEGVESRTVTGTLTFQDADSMTLVDRPEAMILAAPSTSGPPSHQRQLRGHRVSISQVTISSLEISGGRHSSTSLGALIGAGVGLAGGIALGVNYMCSHNGDYFLCTDGVSEIVALSFITTAASAGIGAIVGSLIHHERWQPVPRQPLVTPILGRQGRGVAVGVALRF
jgi:hypothetical protein